MSTASPQASDDATVPTETLEQRLDVFKAVMLDKFKQVEHKHRGNSVTDPNVDWLTFNWEQIETHFVDEFCEYFGLFEEERKKIWKVIRANREFRAFQGDRGRAGPLWEPNEEEEAIDVANMAFLMWWRALQNG